MRHLFSRIWNQIGAGLLNHLGWNTHHQQFTYIKVGSGMLVYCTQNRTEKQEKGMLINNGEDG